VPKATDTFKLPKSPAACADLLYTLRQDRLALQKQVDAIQERETALNEYFRNSLPKDTTGISGKLATVQTGVKSVPTTYNPHTDQSEAGRRAAIACKGECGEPACISFNKQQTAEHVVEHADGHRTFKLCVPLRVNVERDGNMVMALIGSNIQEGLAGFGGTVAQALRELAAEIERKTIPSVY
jgi:hypothetical protein